MAGAFWILWKSMKGISSGGGGGVALQSDLSNTATDEAWVFW